MAYADLLSDETIKQRTFAVLTPRRRVTTWTNVSGFIYKASYDFPHPTSVEFNGVELTEVDTPTVDASEWYFDETNQELYMREPQSGDPDSGQAVAFYPLYVCTAGPEAYWHSTPTDSNADLVYFEPIIAQPPSVKSTTSDSLFGFLPVQSSSIILLNAEHWAEKHCYDSSFNGASIKVYHLLGEDMDVDNFKLIYDGAMSNVAYKDDRVSIRTVDRIDEFSVEYRNDDTSFFSTADFPSCDPSYVGRPIRYVYGIVKGFKPVNVDYLANAPGVTVTTSDNRDWVVCGEQTGLSEISRTVGGGTHTATRTYVNFVEGIQVGDTVWLDRASGTDAYREVTAISISPAYIEHLTITTPMTDGDAVKKGFVSRVEIEQQNVRYLAYYGRDYTISTAMAAGTSGFSFSTSLEANLSLPAVLSPNDKVFCTVYGRVNDLTAGGPTFGANDDATNNLANPVMVIYDLMRRVLGIPESRINLTTFAAVRTSTATEGLGFAIPDTASGGFPTLKAIVAQIVQSSLIRVFIDTNQKWSISLLEPLSTASVTATNETIFDPLSYDFNYSDVISDVIVEYEHREIPNVINTNVLSRTVTSSSSYAMHVHKVNKQKTFKSLHFKSTDAQTLADRLAFVLGDREGTIELAVRNSFFETLLNDTIAITRDKVPGFEYVQDTDRTRNAAVSSVTKSQRGVIIEASDQKGVEDNSGSW